MPASSPAPFNANGKQAAARRRRPDWLEQPEIWVVLAILGAVVLAGGGTPIWARGGILVLVGAWVAVRPPTAAPSRLFEVAVLALVALGVLSSFLPASWLGPGTWRGDLARLGVVLPTTNATAPWLAGEAVAQLVAGLVWLYLCLNLRLNHESRKFALWGLAGLGALLSAGAAIGNILHYKYPLGLEAVNFSYFPNRNQSALWYCLGGIVAFGLMIEGLRRRRPRFLLAGALLAPCLLALVMGRSRMALALFVVGTVAVVLVRMGREAGPYIMNILVPLGVLGAILLFVFADTETLARLPGLGATPAAAASIAPEFRLFLWHDTLDLAQAQPAGVGLGQFSQVFPQYREYSRTYQSVRHPDSDWFWLLGEVGWAGLVAGLVAVGALVARFLGPAGRNCGPYRHLAAICAILFLLHSLVDVPAHRFGTWMLAAWLVAVAAPDFEKHPRSLVSRLVWRVVGLALLAVGVVWLVAQAGVPLESTLIVDRARLRSDAAVQTNNEEAMLASARQAQAIQPLQWWPYFQRARAELAFENNPGAALADFRIARFLDPTTARVPFTEGLLWEPTSHAQAFAAWREALHREDPTPEGLWRDIYNQLGAWPDGDDYATILSKTSPEDRWEFLAMQVAPARVPAEMADEVQRDPALASYTPAQRRDLLERWASLAPGAALAYLADHPKIVNESWQIEVAALAASKHYGDAFDLAYAHLPPAPLPDFAPADDQNDASLLQAMQQYPTDLAPAVALLKRQMDAKNFDDALKTLGLLAQRRKPPPFVSWWMADLLGRAGKKDEAWQALQPYLDYERSLDQKP